jgi:hypothetical protein
MIHESGPQVGVQSSLDKPSYARRTAATRRISGDFP